MSVEDEELSKEGEETGGRAKEVQSPIYSEGVPSEGSSGLLLKGTIEY